MRRWMTAGAAVACVALAAAAWAGEAKPGLDALSKQLAAWTYGQSREPKVDMAERIRASHQKPAERQKLVAALVGLLGAKDATAECKAFCCEQLSIVAGAEVVPVLARLLPDPKLHHRARTGLERIPGDEASAALRDFLPKAPGKLLIGTVNSLGERRDAKAVPALVKLLGHGAPPVVAAAAVALGKIGGPDATAALAKAKDAAKPGTLRSVVAGAYLRCADHLVAAKKNAEAWAIYESMYTDKETPTIRIAALRGLVNADRGKAAPLVAAFYKQPGLVPVTRLLGLSFLLVSFAHVPGARDIESGTELLFAWIRISITDICEGLPIDPKLPVKNECAYNSSGEVFVFLQYFGQGYQGII